MRPVLKETSKELFRGIQKANIRKVQNRNFTQQSNHAGNSGMKGKSRRILVFLVESEKAELKLNKKQLILVQK